MKRLYALLFFISLCGVIYPGILSAGDDAERTAATLFHNQQYAEALAIWQKMANNKSNAGLYFNIGLAESNLHHSAEAIYAYEQALLLRPNNSTYLKALGEERKKLDNPVIPLKSFFLERWYAGWITLLRPGIWALLGLIIVLGVLVTYLVTFKASPEKTRLPFGTFQLVGVLGLFFLITSFLSYQHLYNHDEGIIMHVSELKQASTNESPVLRSLPAGEKVRIKDQIGEWYYVALLNLDYGWIKKDDFKWIALSGSEKVN